VQCRADDEVLQLVEEGTNRRRYRAMPLNPVSSRSHAIVQLNLQRTLLDGSTTDASLYLVDLMGSEALVSDLSSTVRKETTGVNSDLLCLEKVVMALSGLTGRSVPVYRDSLLTWVLREVLGGNSKSAVLTTCSPHHMQRTATEKTLQFAIKCKGIERIVTKARAVKHDREDMEALISSLQVELAATQHDNVELRDRLEDLACMAPQAPEWMEKMRATRYSSDHYSDDFDSENSPLSSASGSSTDRGARSGRSSMGVAGLVSLGSARLLPDRAAHTDRSHYQPTHKAVPKVVTFGGVQNGPNESWRDLNRSVYAAGRLGSMKGHTQDDGHLSSHMDVDEFVVRQSVNRVFDSNQWPGTEQEVSRETNETKAIAGWIFS